MEELAYEYQRDLSDHFAAVVRRRKPMLVTAVLLLAIAAIVAVALPPVYRSTATILIEEQEIPTDLVRSTISSYADQRIQVISQQVMTRSNLLQIVDKYDLYASERKHETSEEILLRLRKDIKVDIVNADVIDRRSGAKTAVTIAFTLSYDGDNAEKTQKVANELTSLYLNENLQLRQRKAADTSKFLAEEADRLGAHIGEAEAKLAIFKTRNQGRLPELAQLNMQMRDRTESELLDLDRRLSSIDERRFYLEAQLAQIKPNTPIISTGGERILDPDERLRTLHAQYAGMSGIYAANHPDMVRMRQQIEALERETGAGPDQAEVEKQLIRMQGELATLRDRYADEHPDIVKLKGRITALELRIQKLATDVPSKPASTRKPENPAYISLQSQLETVNSDAVALEKQRTSLKKRMVELESRLEQTPGVERDYLDLTRDRENSVVRYRELKAKLMEAEVSQAMEKDRKSERFSLIDPPITPEKPRSPNRPLILLVGAVLALAGAGTSVGVLETLDKSVHSARELTSLLPLPLLSVIPQIGNADDARRSRRHIHLGLWLAVAAGIALLAAIHFLWMPLDVFWFAVLRRLQLA
jgi:uncharacterized protein involved in exopolysaccharide biosynthesis